jgi:hypothetical protein
MLYIQYIEYILYISVRRILWKRAQRAQVYGNLYIEPLTAANLVLDDNDGELAGEHYRPERLSAEISLVAGHFFEF